MSDWQRDTGNRLSVFPTSFTVAYRQGTRTRFRWKIVPELFNERGAKDRQALIASQHWPAIIMPAGTPAPTEWEPEGYVIKCDPTM
jgi:hypothetical protein